MDPLTILAVAQVGVGIFQQIWNYNAGQSAIAVEDARLKKQQGFLDQAHQNTVKSQAAGFLDAQKAVGQVAGQTQTDFARRGITGPMADIAATAASNQAGNQVDSQYAQQRTATELQFAQQTDAMANATADLKAQQDQLDMNNMLGWIGIGTSAAGALLKDNAIYDSIKGILGGAGTRSGGGGGRQAMNLVR